MKSPFRPADARKRRFPSTGIAPAKWFLRFKEGETAKIRVTNKLDRDTSIHWHGLILPFTQDGVPGISYDGIAPGESFDYEFPLVQSGTYWFHSHSGMQEQDGAYGALAIEPKEREPFRYDREHVLVLSDLHPHGGEQILSNLKRIPDYYNRQQETLGDFFSRGRRGGACRRRARPRGMGNDADDEDGHFRRAWLRFSDKRARAGGELDGAVQAGRKSAAANHQRGGDELF